MEGGVALQYEWHVPTIATLHLAVLFGSACMMYDALSLGYVVLFLNGYATLTDRTVWTCRTYRWEWLLKAFPFEGARGGGCLINFYVVIVMCFSAVSFIFHGYILAVKMPNAPRGNYNASSPNSEYSKDGRMFETLLSMGLDAMIAFTAAGIANVDKLDHENENMPRLMREPVVVRHALVTLAVSLKPCALTAPYLLYSLVHLWRWTLSSQGSARVRSVSRLDFDLLRKFLGFYAGVHLVLLYFFGASLDGVSVTLACPLVDTLGLVPGADWSWVEWVDFVNILFLFLASFRKVCTVRRHLYAAMIFWCRCLLDSLLCSLRMAKP